MTIGELRRLLAGKDAGARVFFPSSDGLADYWTEADKVHNEELCEILSGGRQGCFASFDQVKAAGGNKKVTTGPAIYGVVIS